MGMNVLTHEDLGVGGCNDKECLIRKLNNQSLVLRFQVYSFPNIPMHD